MTEKEIEISKKEFHLISKQYDNPKYFYQKDDENNKIILIMKFDQDSKKQPVNPNTNNVSNLTPEFFENMFNKLLDQRFGKNNCLLLEEIDKRIDKRINALEQRFDAFEQRFNALEVKVDQGFEKINKDIEMLKSFHKKDIEEYEKKKK
ncbi:hypothetical protein ACJA25_01665 [Mycoplasmopsis hyopharyngis]|uniref:hypothetical protein n=1 Tax=Mycoplasmopsis hyopharyngis TaxID=29558 RepID=UPI003872AFFA